MDKALPLTSPMIVQSLDIKKKDCFHPPKEGENFLGHEVLYLSVIGALTYLANCIQSDIIFSVNLLTRYSSAPTRRYWNGIKLMSPKFFYTHEIKKKSDIDIQ